MCCLGLKFNMYLLFLFSFYVFVKCDYVNDDKFPYEFLENGEEVSEATTDLLVDLRMPTECETPNLDPGWCIEIQDCPILFKYHSNQFTIPFLKASMCGPKNEDVNKPKVCCGRYNYFINGNPTANVKKKIFPKHCGNQTLALNSRLLGGFTADLGEFPWIARLTHRNQKGFRSIGCTAFLIHHKYVLSAAHCVHPEYTKLRGPVYYVILGEHNTETKIDCNQEGTECAEPIQQIRVVNVIMHPKYDNGLPGHYNDIALIKLKKGARFTKFVQPICLQAETDHIPGKYSISGWGKTEKEQFSSIKMKVELPSVNKEECVEKFKTIPIELAETQICAGGEAKKDSCSGDSGGPLMFANGGTWFAAGIVSFGIGCGRKGWPGVYTYLPSYIPWIEDEIFNNNLVSTRSTSTNRSRRKKN